MPFPGLSRPGILNNKTPGLFRVCTNHDILIFAVLERWMAYLHYYNHFTTLCPGLPRWVGTRRTNHSGFCWSRHEGVAVASAEPYASYLHFAPEDNHASTSSVRFLWAGCPSWHPTNSVKALKATSKHWRPDGWLIYTVMKLSGFFLNFALLLCKFYNAFLNSSQTDAKRKWKSTPLQSTFEVLLMSTHPRDV